MTLSELMAECRQSGVTLGMDARKGLTFRGDREAVNRLLPDIRQHKPALLAILAGKEDEAQHHHHGTHGTGLAVTVHTPAGTLVTVHARDEAHAEQIRRWNPKPPARPAQARCRDCRHATGTGHPSLIDCAAGVRAPGNCGPVRWWADDPHHCQEFAHAHAYATEEAR